METSFLTQLQIPGNTIHITQDIELTQDVSLGLGTMLIFDGGRILGHYSLEGRHTTIIAPPTQIFSSDVAITGIWNVPVCYCEWWGAGMSEAQNDTAGIQSAFASPFSRIQFLAKSYYVLQPITISRPVLVLGMTGSGGQTRICVPDSCETNIDHIIGIGSDFVSLKNFIIVNESGAFLSCGLKTIGERYRLVLDQVVAWGCGTGFHLHTFLTTIKRCKAENVSTGFYIESGTSTTLLNCIVNRYQNNGFHFCEMTYSSLIDCRTETWLSGASDFGQDLSCFSFLFDCCNSISLINNSAVSSPKGLCVCNSQSIMATCCEFDLPFMSSVPQEGCVITSINSSRIQVNGLTVTNWQCTGWEQANGWYNARGVIKISGDNAGENTIRLHNVQYRGFDCDTIISGHAEVHQNLAAQLIAVYSSEGTSSSVDVVYDWKKSGSSAERPSNLDTIIGVGWSYYNTDVGRIQIWTGYNWHNL